jgi:cytidylate kinase
VVIAIDGPAGAGKSTVSRALAERLGFTYLDSGAMYRCAALGAIRAGADLDSENEVGEIAEELDIGFDGAVVRLDGEDVSEAIRQPEVSAAASRVSVHPRVRAAMVVRQRELIDAGRYVAEGRDIGTVVAPEAPLKIFLTASADERARRRAAETGEHTRTVLDALSVRDERDSSRAHGAMRPADDSVELDTTGLDVPGVVDRIAALAADRGLL